MSATIIIPFHRNLQQLAQSLPAARKELPTAEILIAADGAVDDCRPLAEASDARVIDIPGPSGPAVARNRAAAQASGQVLVFVDADVVAQPGSLSGLCRVLEQEPDVAAVFGAYDMDPPERNFMSQYKNLSHAQIHELANREARTFWAGLGAIRATAFHEVRGFDERFARPSVEDIDLGYRVRRAGYRLRVDPAFRGRHLKKWTLRSSVTTDVVSRGIPWTQLIHRYGALTNDLNIGFDSRASVLLAYLIAGALAAAVWRRAALWVAAVGFLAFVAINFRYYAWFARRRGWGFAVRVVPAHLVHHLCNGVSFAAGTLDAIAARAGVPLPGALPISDWTTAMADATPVAVTRR
ncbi:MAG TPA: glycosyltransferase [Vicinamibacterales bacterium]|nr:glycosyltransferase [Vicinamibacterales bacterium]